MEKVYILGHRNPDFDSVCSAYAYAKLKNQTDLLKKYIPVRCGHLPESMKKVFAQLFVADSHIGHNSDDVPEFARETEAL